MRAVPDEMASKVMSAATLFAEHGLDGSTMEAIAETTGIPKATLYYYFDGKSDLLTFLFRELLRVLGEAVTSAADKPGSAADRLAGVIRAHLEVFERYPEASRTMQFELGRAARVPEITALVDEAFLGPVRELLREGAADGSLRAVDHPRVAATAILGAITTTGINAIASPPGRSVTDVARTVEAIVLDGLRKEHG